jgi:DNA helicase-2/ATP-dependent DNA helicase PcrA
MRTPTPEQQAILVKDARVRVVRAVPGSGKTWLVAEAIRQTLDRWPNKTSGIAALSFTRVGGDEIRKAVGYDLGHPHFVGTIDAFLFRYVIRPHLCRVFNGAFAVPRIVAGEWGADNWSKCSPTLNATVGQGVKLFGCVFIDERQGKAVVAHKPHPAQPLRELAENDANAVKDAKRKIWKNCGLLTHSDAALWASKILTHPKLGAVVRAEVIRRFPFLIVDELQDTGHFLANSIRLLLDEPVTRGLLVGDPDQAIYEFSGARPDLFNAFETIDGAVTLPLSRSLRCPPAVSTVASHLKDSTGVFLPAQDRNGRALLIRYNNMVADMPKVLEAIRLNSSAALVKVVARGTATVEELTGRRANHAPSLYCRSLTHICRGVRQLRQGKNVNALAATRAALELAIFQHEGVTDEELTSARISAHEWKAFAVRCLLKVNTIPTVGTCFEWHQGAGEILDREIISFGLHSSLKFEAGKLKPQKRKGWQKPSSDFIPTLNAGGATTHRIPVQTVHGVKGETHDVTVFVCPTSSKLIQCPSNVWWSTNDKDREEKRIAYVAMTRTRGDLIVCVSEACFTRLSNDHAPFVESFECMNIADYLISEMNAAGTNYKGVSDEAQVPQSPING